MRTGYENGFVNYLPRTGNNVILLEDLEFAMPKDQLEDITKLHNDGINFQDIAKEVKRHPYEVIIALLHQVKQGRHMRPFAFRKQGRN